MSNTNTHPAIRNAAGFGAIAAAAQVTKAGAVAQLEGWKSAKMLCATQFAHDCAIDPDALALADDVTNAFTIAAGGKALSGDSLKSQGRKMSAWGKVGKQVPLILADIESICADLSANANVPGADASAKARFKAATTRVFEKGTAIMRDYVQTGAWTHESLTAVLTEAEAPPTLAKRLAAAHAALAAAAKLVEGLPGHDWRDYVVDLEAAAKAEAARETKEKAETKAAADAADAKGRADAARAARQARLPAPTPEVAAMPRDEVTSPNADADAFDSLTDLIAA